jgi:hypothetical protein
LRRSPGLFRIAPARQVLLAFALSSSAGCGSHTPNEAPWITMSGTHVSLSYHSGSTPCLGTLPYLDASAQAIALDLGLPLPNTIAYYYTQDLPCPIDAAGCTLYQPGAPASCWSQQPGTVHELVHAVQLDQTGDGPRLLLEGEAVALGETSMNTVLVATSDSELLAPGALPALDYPLAGDFISYLLTRFGAAPFEQVLSGLHTGSTADEIEMRFGDIYGETMTQLRTDRATSPATFAGARVDLPECLSTPPDPQIASGQTVSESLDCSTNALGLVGGSLSRAVPFDIAADGLYELDLQAPAGAMLYLTECGGGPSLSYATGEGTYTAGENFSGPALIVGYLPKGHYFFWLTGPWSDSPSVFSVSVRPLAQTSDPMCATLTPIGIPAGTQRVYLFSMIEQTLEVPFVLDSQANLAGGFVGFGGSAQLCAAGCGAGCSSIFGASSTLAAGDTFTLQATLAGTTKFAGVSLQ